MVGKEEKLLTDELSFNSTEQHWIIIMTYKKLEKDRNDKKKINKKTRKDQRDGKGIKNNKIHPTCNTYFCKTHKTKNSGATLNVGNTYFVHPIYLL